MELGGKKKGGKQENECLLRRLPSSQVPFFSPGRKKKNASHEKKEKRERDRENVEGKEKDEEERAQRLHLFLLVSSKRSPRSRHDDQVHIQVQNKVGTYQPYKALFTTK